jgi:hypothetical protein
MTTPTQAQIEAAGIAYWNFYRQLDGNKPEAAFTLDGDFAGAITAALTAAAQVGEPELSQSDRQEVGKVLRAIVDERLTTIERCAQVADKWHYGHDAADAIRKLKDMPAVDPNIIHPGKDPDFVFPEE